jgi:pyruvate/2-oxoglutarate/acetoin dehydrogenase E1 component
VPLSLAEVKREGKDISVVTYGIGVHYALEAAELLDHEGVTVEVVDLRTIAPMDMATVGRSISKTNKVLIVHEDNKTGGVGAEVAATLAEEYFEQLDGPILRVAAADAHLPYAPSLEAAIIPNVDDVVAALRRLAAY